MTTMTRDQKVRYRGGFIQCMNHISFCDIEVVKGIADNEVDKYHTEWYAKGYKDAYHSWMGDVSYFSCEYAYEMREEYEGYYGQGSYVHPKP